MRKLLAIAVGLLLATGATADGAEIKVAHNARTSCDVDEAPRETRPDDAIMSGRGTATRPLSLALLGISNSSLRPKPRALSHHRSAGRAQFLLNRFQPIPESAIYGTDFFWRNSARGDVGQYSALKHGDLVQRHLLDLSYPRLNIGICFRRFPVAHELLPG